MSSIKLKLAKIGFIKFELDDTNSCTANWLSYCESILNLHNCTLKT